MAISINLFFAGILTILLPSIDRKLKPAGTLGLFAGLNIVAFVLIFFLVQETKALSLEDLDHLFNIPMRDFAKERLEKLVSRRGPSETVNPPPRDASPPPSRDAATPRPRDDVVRDTVIAPDAVIPPNTVIPSRDAAIPRPRDAVLEDTGIPPDTVIPLSRRPTV